MLKKIGIGVLYLFAVTLVLGGLGSIGRPALGGSAVSQVLLGLVLLVATLLGTNARGLRSRVPGFNSPGKPQRVGAWVALVAVGLVAITTQPVYEAPPAPVAVPDKPAATSQPPTPQPAAVAVKAEAPTTKPQPTATPRPTNAPRPTATARPAAQPAAAPTRSPAIAATNAPADAGAHIAAPAPPASGLEMEILSVTSPVARNETATLSARTVPGAQCTIAVYYSSGASKAAGLEPQTSGESGAVSWSWKVGGNTNDGSYRIAVTATKDGATVRKETTFAVQ